MNTTVVETSLMRRLRTAAKALLTGNWRWLWWREGLRFRGVDIDYASREELGLSLTLSGDHAITPGPELERVLKALGIRADDRIIDIGCGKGAALISLAKFPFAAIAGCDISPELIRIAEQNLNKLGIKNATLYCGDAATFRELDAYNYVYFFNPFSAAVFEVVARNIKDSLCRRPRDMSIIYYNPRSHDVIVQGTLFEKTREFRYGKLPFAVYVHRENH